MFIVLRKANSAEEFVSWYTYTLEMVQIGNLQLSTPSSLHVITQTYLPPVTGTRYSWNSDLTVLVPGKETAPTTQLTM